jgi:hypothetical protein
MSEAEQLADRQPAPMSDLFATAVHRFGNAWADLVVATAVALGVASVPVLVVGSYSSNRATYVASLLCYGVAYFALLGQIVLRGLPQRTPVSRVLATYATALVVGPVAAFLVVALWFYSLIVLPLLLLIVPAVAAGDRRPAAAVVWGVRLAVANFRRVWTMWMVTVLFSAPVAISMFLMVQSFSGAITATLLAFALAAPIAWPFSALFIRALYGDLTGRLVVAPQDRTR